MPEIKISLTDEEYEELKKYTKQYDYISEEHAAHEMIHYRLMHDLW